MTNATFIDTLLAYRQLRNAREGLVPDRLASSEADRLMHQLLTHAIEEVIELVMCINRKSWKPMASIKSSTEAGLSLRARALEELVDVLLMLDAFRDVAGFTFEDVQSAMADKMLTNLNRQDHFPQSNNGEV